MQKLLIFTTLTASLTLGGCSTVIDSTMETMASVKGVFPDDLEVVEVLPGLYKPTIQQGNKIEQEQINKLEPGMTKRQVRFLMGTPMVTDVFHRDRWDYVYSTGIGSSPSEIKKLALEFEGDRLSSISGDYFPQPHMEEEAAKKEIYVSVPDWQEAEPSIWDEMLEYVGLKKQN